MNSHPEQWAAIYAAAPGEQLGVWCLIQGHLSCGIDCGESAAHSFPPPTIPANPSFGIFLNIKFKFWILTVLESGSVVIDIHQADGHRGCGAVASGESEHIFHLNQNQIRLPGFSVHIRPRCYNYTYVGEK